MEGQTHINVLFWGNYIPLQGIPTIVQAAARFASGNVHFDIIGDGQTLAEVMALAGSLDMSNVSFHGRKPLSEIPSYIARSDICLGIFGVTGKASRVIPNKLYEAIAMAKPVITADTPAVRELFVDGQNIILCRAGDPGDLADKILILAGDPALRARIARGGYEAYQKHCTPKTIGLRLLQDII